ncbi:Histidine kinase [Pontibacter lucknowensis]|uniref:Histidine kinase n=2 Tax=Pontibacter lucknowensis TaxID=1077936 RepID=A0A1N6WCX8_9BACT|nr:Histidine kinase [Pontibacter lucknowensis]
MRTLTFNKQASLYPNQSTRLLWHLVFWGFMSCLSVVNTAYMFNTSLLNLSTLSYAFLTIVVIYFNHTMLSYYGLGFIQNKHWVKLLALLLLLYLVCTILIQSLSPLSALFPDNQRMRIYSERIYINSIADIFSLNTFIWIFSIPMFGTLFAFAAKTLKNSYEANKRNAMLQKEKTEMELNFLRAQIHPHFLFNTLNNIYGMVMENERAGQVVLKLSDLLRFSLYESSGKRIPIGREVEFLADYINLEQIRHHNTRVAISYDFDHIKNKETPIVPLLLISFVENAFKHGVNATIGKAWVRISLKQEGDTILFHVENSKPDTKKERPATTGIGIENAKRRLALLYPDKHHLNITETADSYKVSLTLHTND